MAGTIQTSKVVSVTVTATPDYFHVMNMGGQDVGALTEITVKSGNAILTGDPAVGNDVGDIGNYTITGPADVGKRDIVIMGTFNDGTTQVLLTKKV